MKVRLLPLRIVPFRHFHFLYITFKLLMYQFLRCPSRQIDTNCDNVHFCPRPFNFSLLVIVPCLLNLLHKLMFLSSFYFHLPFILKPEFIDRTAKCANERKGKRKTGKRREETLEYQNLNTTNVD